MYSDVLPVDVLIAVHDACVRAVVLRRHASHMEVRPDYILDILPARQY